MSSEEVVFELLDGPPVVLAAPPQSPQPIIEHHRAENDGCFASRRNAAMERMTREAERMSTTARSTVQAVRDAFKEHVAAARFRSGSRRNISLEKVGGSCGGLSDDEARRRRTREMDNREFQKMARLERLESARDALALARLVRKGLARTSGGGPEGGGLVAVGEDTLPRRGVTRIFRRKRGTRDRARLEVAAFVFDCCATADSDDESQGATTAARRYTARRLRKDGAREVLAAILANEAFEASDNEAAKQGGLYDSDDSGDEDLRPPGSKDATLDVFDDDGATAATEDDRDPYDAAVVSGRAGKG